MAEKVKLLRSHGESPRHNHSSSPARTGSTPLQAAILDVKLRHLDDWTRSPGRRRQARRGTADTDVTLAGPPASDGDHVYHLFVIPHPSATHCAITSTPAASQRHHYPTPVHLQPPTRTSFQPRLVAGGRAAGKRILARCRSSRRSRTGISRDRRGSAELLAAPATAERKRQAGAVLRVCMVHYSDFAVDSRSSRQARALAERAITSTASA